MFITFRVARFKYETLTEVLPPPTGIEAKDGNITATYHFGQKHIGGRQIMRVGLIKKTIENIFDDEVTWLGISLGIDIDKIYGIDEFYRKYCKFKTYPRWLWARHRKDLMTYGMRYAVRLHERGLFCFETVLGYLYLQNNRLKSRITKFEELEKKARWVVAKMHERIDAGEFDKLTPKELAPIRKEAGEAGGVASSVARRSKTDARREQVKKLLNDGKDAHSIASRLNVSVRTIQRDMKSK